MLTHTHVHVVLCWSMFLRISLTTYHAFLSYSGVRWWCKLYTFLSQLLHWTNCWLAMHAGKILFYKWTIKQNRLFPLSVETFAHMHLCWERERQTDRQNSELYYTRIKIIASCLFLQSAPVNLRANRLHIKQQ